MNIDSGYPSQIDYSIIQKVVLSVRVPLDVKILLQQEADALEITISEHLDCILKQRWQDSDEIEMKLSNMTEKYETIKSS